MATKNHEIVKIRNGIARQLRDTRISAHLSLAQVEKLSGIPANIIDLLEVGIKPVDLGHLHQLAKACGKAVKIPRIEKKPRNCGAFLLVLINLICFSK